MQSNTDIEGGCFCGAVRYRAVSAPIGSMVCHCQTCRQVSGAPAVPWVTFMKSHFAFVTGQPETLHSSQNVVRTFCSNCGTPLSYTSTAFPDEVDITTCTLDEPNAYPPTHHSWTSHRLSWTRIDDGLPRYIRSKQDGEEE